MGFSPSVLGPWWDYTSYCKDNPGLCKRVRELTVADLAGLSKPPRFTVNIYPTREAFFVAEALEYARAWQQSTVDNPVAICGPVGPVEQLPLVATIINELGINVSDGWFLGMDEFVEDGEAIPYDHPLSFARTDLEMCWERIEPKLRMPREQWVFPTHDVSAYARHWNTGMRVATVQGGQGNMKHIAFNDPLPRLGAFAERPPTVDEYRALGTRLVDLHPATIVQDARHSTGGEEAVIPIQAVTVGMYEILTHAEQISIWHPGWHDNEFGVRLTALMIAEGIVDARVPMSLLGLHSNVTFSYLGPNIKPAGFDMH